MYITETSVKGRLVNNPKFITGNRPSRDRIWGEIAIFHPETQNTDLMAFIAWGAQARTVRDHCQKGMLLTVQGALHTRNHPTGQLYVEINARNVSFDLDVYKTADPVAQHTSEKMTQKEAYEQNKKLVNCIVCGKELHMHPSVGVKYCKCIEQLP